MIRSIVMPIIGAAAGCWATIAFALEGNVRMANFCAVLTAANVVMLLVHLQRLRKHGK